MEIGKEYKKEINNKVYKETKERKDTEYYNTKENVIRGRGILCLK